MAFWPLRNRLRFGPPKGKPAPEHLLLVSRGTNLLVRLAWLASFRCLKVRFPLNLPPFPTVFSIFSGEAVNMHVIRCYYAYICYIKRFLGIYLLLGLSGGSIGRHLFPLIGFLKMCRYNVTYVYNIAKVNLLKIKVKLITSLNFFWLKHYLADLEVIK